MSVAQDPDYDQFEATFDIKESISQRMKKNPKFKLYAFLDTTGDTDIFAEFRGYEPEAEFEILFDNLIGAEPSPFVISLNPEGEFLEYIVKREEEFNLNLITFYLSDIELTKQFPHWQQTLFVADTTGETLLFRFYDPRVLAGFLSVSTDKEQSAIFGPASYLWVIEEDGSWMGLSNPDIDYATKFSDDAPDITVNMATPPIVLRHAHIKEANRLAEINMVDIIIDHIRNEEPRLIDDYTTEELKPIVLSAIYRAKKYNINDEASLCSWAMFMFDISPSFDEQTNINKALRNESNKPNKKIDFALRSTSSEDWQEASELYNKNCCDPDYNLKELQNVS